MSTPCCDTVIQLVTSCNSLKPQFIWNPEHFFSVKDLISIDQKLLSLQTRNKFPAVFQKNCVLAGWMVLSSVTPPENETKL